MTSRPKRRDTWHTTRHGTWTCTLGKRGGVTVRLFENRRSRYYYADVHKPGRGRSRTTLNTNDRVAADQLGRELYAKALLGISAERAAHAQNTPVRLADVCDRFLKECGEFLNNIASTQNDARFQLGLIRRVFSDDRDVRTLTKDNAVAYQTRRLAGGIRYVDRDGKSERTGPVRQRTVQSDLKLLKQVLAWACTVVGADGRPWLERNPLAGTKIAGESDVRRPVASQDRFLATRGAMRAMQQRYEDEAARTGQPKARRRAEARAQAWTRAELALLLMEGTGRRRGSIARLAWTDVDFEQHRIVWRAANDKKRKTWTVVYPAPLFDELRALQRRLAVVGGSLFPRGDDAERTIAPELISQWVLKAERLAGLPKLDGGVTHPYRRKWKSERAHHPVMAVAQAGGWSDTATMLNCYDIPDDSAILAVTSEPRRRWENPVAATAAVT